ncbi:MAG: DUF4197 domain-containing protein [Ichthyobacteriaceae bacterium]|nr:DUF4197 domain-containing protein [Ichthyobacteriaceae bacterium]
MKNYKKYLLFGVLSFAITSCDVVDNVLGVAEDEIFKPEYLDISQGLKEALNVGTDTAVVQLNKKNSYFGDELIKIVLPEEAKIIFNHKDDDIFKAVGISKQIDDVILTMNRVAEQVAIEAKPIFTDAILDITIDDAEGILYGEDNAATEYLKSKSNTKLFDTYSPKVDSVMKLDLGLGYSADDAWVLLSENYNEYVDEYNVVANLNNSTAEYTGLDLMELCYPVTTNLGGHVTEKALFGLYMKIEDEEKLIRKDPMARVTKLLEDVFGKLDE